MDNLTYEKHLISKAARSHTPINGSLELLPLCNMNCGMCYVRLSRPEMERQGHLHSVSGASQHGYDSDDQYERDSD